MTQATTRAFTKIKESGLRLTSARKQLLTTLSTLTHPASITEIAEHTAIDTATTYRNIKTLQDIGLLETITLEDGSVRYALAHDHHHDHIVCTNCGTIVHIPCTLPHRTSITHPDFSTITHHSVTYFGLCSRCAHSSRSCS